MDYNEAYNNFLKAKRELAEAKEAKYKEFMASLRDGTVAKYGKKLVVFQQVITHKKGWLAFVVYELGRGHEQASGYSRDMPRTVEVDLGSFTHFQILDNNQAVAEIQRRTKKEAEDMTRYYGKGRY